LEVNDRVNVRDPQERQISSAIEFFYSRVKRARVDSQSQVGKRLKVIQAFFDKGLVCKVLFLEILWVDTSSCCTF